MSGGRLGTIWKRITGSVKKKTELEKLGFQEYVKKKGVRKHMKKDFKEKAIFLRLTIAMLEQLQFVSQYLGYDSISEYVRQAIEEKLKKDALKVEKAVNDPLDESPGNYKRYKRKLGDAGKGG